MIALIDTVFSPIIGWLVGVQQMLQNASVVQGYNIPLGNIFAPIAMISPAWALLISNVFVMAVVYGILFIVNNGTGLLETFKKIIKFW